MSTITWEQFQTAFQTAPSAVKEIVNSEIIPDLVDELMGEYHIDTQYRSSLIESIGNSALSLTSMVQSLEVVAIPDGSRARFLQKIQNTITPGASKKVIVPGTPVLPDEVPKGQPTPNIPTATSTTPPAAMRTMESDIGKIHGYGAAASQGAGVATKAEAVVQSLSQEDLQRKNAAVPDYSATKEMKME